MNTSKLFRFLISNFHKYANRLIQYSKDSNDSFLTGTSSQYIEDMYNAWLKDPGSVHPSWDNYFKTMKTNPPVKTQPNPPPPTSKPNPPAPPSKPKPPDPIDPPIGSIASIMHTKPPTILQASSGGASAATGGGSSDKNIEDHLAVQGVIRSFQARGHVVADIDPLGLLYSEKSTSPPTDGTPPKEVLKKFKLDMDKMYTLPSITFIGGNEKKLPLKEIINRLEKAYCGSIGVEFMYIDDMEERRFLREKMETPGIKDLSPELKKKTLKRLVETTELENFFGKKWASEKRFGIEGCDIFVPAVRQIIDRSNELGIEHFFMGVAHRGRLNLLANVFHKPLYTVFNQFEPLEPGDIGAGDVKYHYGSVTEKVNKSNNKKFKMTLLANPSHLEVVNSSVLGRCRAEQVVQNDPKGEKSMAILMHGDAAFSGQGVNYETLGLSYLPNYTTHGSICIIINNQVGFTTDPRFSRSFRYCSCLGKVVNAPIFHVNGDDPDAVIHVCNVAAEYRAKFHKDVVIDIIGYRRHGHNEADEPSFTQPIMYQIIKNMKTIEQKYREKLVAEKIITDEEVQHIIKDYNKYCDEQFEKATKQTQVYIKDWIDSPWDQFFEGRDPLKMEPTGLPEATLIKIGEKFAAPPPKDFELHKGLLRILNARKKLIEEKQADWAMGEAFAFGSLLLEGIPVRLSGEDVERGTFSHRHHVLHHQVKDKVTYEPLNNLDPGQARYKVCNSSLSEYGVLGFDMGYSLVSPNYLVIWEAQFGDFFNTAQCIFDQFLCSCESKWARQCGIVCYLPHGFEGMGSEHSSGRPERFLQMCDDDEDKIPPDGPDFAMQQLRECNWIIANCSTPGNLFHILRRQVKLPFRKPLIMFTPKSLLRLPTCRSPFSEMMNGTSFRRVIPEDGEASKNAQGVKKLVFCTGKAYYDIITSRGKEKLDKDIAVTRIEQISPFPYDLLKNECAKYPNAKIVWAQEEPKNYGWYHYIRERFNSMLKGARSLGYVGRPVSGSPATGVKAQHIKEVQMLAKAYVAL